MKTEILYSADGEMFSHQELEEAVRDHVDDFGDDVELPATFTIYEVEFTQEPASHYLPTDMIEQMDERAYDYLGEEGYADGLFSRVEFDEKALNDELKAAVDAVFTKHNIQPTAMVGGGPRVEHVITWRGDNKWSAMTCGNVL